MPNNLLVNTLKGVGEKTKQVLNKVGVYTIEDLINYYPRDYDVYSVPVSINEVKINEVNAIEGTIARAPELLRKKHLQVLNVYVKDDTGIMNLVWFNMAFLKTKLRVGTKLIFRGKVENLYGKIQMQQPQIYTETEYSTRLNVMQPIYPLTAGLTNNLLTSSIRQALDIQEIKKEYLTSEIRKKYSLAEYNFAINHIHFPKDFECLNKARQRLIFDEFFLFQLALQTLKENKDIAPNNFHIERSDDVNDLIDKLPYTLTNAQLRVWDDIFTDLTGQTAMNRLIQGDVGSGKTIIAVLALMLIAKNGYQGCLMAPTEVLAKQHYESLTKLLSTYGIRIGILVGSMTAKEKREMYQLIENNDVDIIVGTHALIQEKVKYNNLALVITDEQHRFGVRQRETLSSKGNAPHILVMSATPIPRTLAIIVYGDLDVSVIDELPPNRQVIKNTVVDITYRPKVYRFIEKEARNGRQAYVICPMVEESEHVEAESVVEYVEELRRNISSDIVIDILHGKMKPKDKNEIMEKFSKNQIQVLVSTTVVEVGVNVPNATTIAIENAERFGLAQLHQLRGRVGRGEHQSYCILINGSKNDKTNKRLEVLNKSNDGFFIAEEDLKLRGPGDIFGIRQSGTIEFKIGNIFNDFKILQQANTAAKEVLSIDPRLEANDELRDRVNKYININLNQINL